MTTALAPMDRPGEAERDAVVDAAIAGDDGAFAVLVERHRHELHRHCIRILRSSEQAEDALQEALLRAWRSRSRVTGCATFRAWLYRVATNACLDELRRDRLRPRGQLTSGDRTDRDDGGAPRSAEVVTATERGPDAVVEAKEALERAFLATLQLPPRQRAVLILCEVMRCPAAETATLLDTTVAAVNSALQRARATLSTRGPLTAPDRMPDPRPGSVQRTLLDRYVDTLRNDDAIGVVALARADAAAGPRAVRAY
jgi:RNA polymerase sigma-70 factor, ECF subfamily